MQDFKKFENLTEKIIKKLYSGNHDKIERNVIIESGDGKQEIDILVTSDLGPLKIKTAIECKDYNSPIKREFVYSYIHKIDKLKLDAGIIVASRGFQKGAIKAAKNSNIRLYTAHEALSEKWSFNVEFHICICELLPNLKFFFTPIGDVKNTKLQPGKIILNNINIVENYIRIFKEYSSTEERSIDLLNHLNIKKPYFFDDHIGNKIGVDIKEFTAEFKYKYYYGLVNELKDSVLFNSITDGRSTVFFSISPNIYQNVLQVSDTPPQLSGKKIIVKTKFNDITSQSTIFEVK